MQVTPLRAARSFLIRALTNCSLPGFSLRINLPQHLDALVFSLLHLLSRRISKRFLLNSNGYSLTLRFLLSSALLPSRALLVFQLSHLTASLASPRH